METLRKTGEFVYIPRFDDISDFITRNGEYRQRAKGLSDLVAGTIGMVGGGGLAVGGLALCGPSAGASCATIPLGAFIAKTSNDQAQEGNQALFGAYRSTEGQRVIASFDIETYPGERIPLEEIGVEAGKRALIQVLGKYIPNILMGAEEGVLKRTASEASGSARFPKNSEITSKGDVSPVVARSAGDMTTAAQLRTQLSFQEAGILDAKGLLTEQAVQRSEKISLSGGKINNPAVVSELTKDGSNIADWGKYTTQSVNTANGQSMQIHYYMNSVTGKIDYVTSDYKVKGIVKP